MTDLHDATTNGDFWVGPPGAPDTYRLVSLIGGGGEGEVWRGVLPLSTGGRRQVAVKVMRGPGGPGWDRVGHLLTSLSHPGLVRVTDVFTGTRMHRPDQGTSDTGFRYVVMDHVTGSTLRDWCDENPHATAAERLRMLRTVAAALDEMHSGADTEVAVAHGDVKPANIVVTPEGATVLVDLGLVQLADAAGPAGHSTPYAAPELRVPGAHPTPEADRFAFAVTTAQVLTGQPPPLGRDGWLDVVALGQALAAHPVTARRPVLVGRIIAVLQAPPEARPRPLGMWLDSAAETLSQMTSGGTPSPAAVTWVPDRSGHGDEPTHAFAPVPPAAPAPPRRRRRGRLLLVVGSAVVALLAGGVAVLASSMGGSGARIDPTTPSPAAAAPGSTTTTSGRPTSAVTPTTSAVNSLGLDPSETAYLSQLDAVDEDEAAVWGDASRGTYSTGGERYGRSVQIYAGCGNRDGGDYWVEYDISQDYARLTAAVGLDDASPADSALTYTITGDRRLLASGPLTLGAVDMVDVDVTGVLRLRLAINNPASIQEVCDDASAQRVVFGDAALVP